MGVAVTGIPGIKPTDGLRAWKRDGKDGISALLPPGLLWLQLLRARTDLREGPDSDLGSPADMGNGKQWVLCIPARDMNGYGIPALLLSETRPGLPCPQLLCQPNSVG